MTIDIEAGVVFREETSDSTAKALDIFHGRRLAGGHADEATLLFFHGGGWRAGSRELDRETLLIPLAEAGITVVSADYALTGEAPYPRNLEDIYSALNWVKTRGHEHGINSEHIVIGGASAGSHLAALAVLKGLAEGRAELPVDGVISWYGALDLYTLYLDQKNAPYPRRGSFSDLAAQRQWPFPAKLPAVLGTEDWGTVTADQILDLDPRYHLETLDPAGVPPFLLLSGSGDDGEITDDVRRLHEALRRVEAPVVSLQVQDADHQDAVFGSALLVGIVGTFLRLVTTTADPVARRTLFPQAGSNPRLPL